MQGVVMSSVKYGDNKLIVNILTEEYGRRAYIVSVGAKRSSAQALFMPLSLVEFEASERSKGPLQRLAQVRFAHPFKSIPFSPVLRAEAFFIAELLSKTVPEEIPDTDLFSFVSSSIVALDSDIDGSCNFHIYFMMELASHLGYAPSSERDRAPYFDMRSGEWSDSLPVHMDVVEGRMADLWEMFQLVSIDRLATITMNRDERKELVGMLIVFFRLHHPSFRELKSVSILATLF